MSPTEEVVRRCGAQYEREAGRERGDRIIDCGRPAWHSGNHAEIPDEPDEPDEPGARWTRTAMTWTLPPEPGPEVQRLRDEAGNTYVHHATPEGVAWWESEGRANRYTFYVLLSLVGKLTDATHPGPG